MVQNSQPKRAQILEFFKNLKKKKRKKKTERERERERLKVQPNHAEHLKGKRKQLITLNILVCI